MCAVRDSTEVATRATSDDARHILGGNKYVPPDSFRPQMNQFQGLGQGRKKKAADCSAACALCHKIFAGMRSRRTDNDLSESVRPSGVSRQGFKLTESSKPQPVRAAGCVETILRTP